MGEALATSHHCPLTQVRMLTNSGGGPGMYLHVYEGKGSSLNRRVLILQTRSSPLSESQKHGLTEHSANTLFDPGLPVNSGETKTEPLSFQIWCGCRQGWAFLNYSTRSCEHRYCSHAFRNCSETSNMLWLYTPRGTGTGGGVSPMFYLFISC